MSLNTVKYQRSEYVIFIIDTLEHVILSDIESIKIRFPEVH